MSRGRRQFLGTAANGDTNDHLSARFRLTLAQIDRVAGLLSGARDPFIALSYPPERGKRLRNIPETTARQDSWSKALTPALPAPNC